jgi:hypothetical protein
MRERFLPKRTRRPMARRPMDAGRFRLSPRARTLVGWLAALVLVLGIAGAVRLFGASEDGAAGPSPSSRGVGVLPVVFGTQLTADGVVPVDARTTTFERGMTFAYAVDGGEPATEAYVEVERTDGGPLETVQEPVEGQEIPGAPALIGFTVPAAALIDEWGAGAYLMRIYLEPSGRPIAEGRFVLVEASPSP